MSPRVVLFYKSIYRLFYVYYRYSFLGVLRLLYFFIFHPTGYKYQSF